MAKTERPLTVERDLELGFFDCAATENAIEDLAGASSITFFLGAGVSADQGVPTWSDLVLRLLKFALPSELENRTIDEPSGKKISVAQAFINRYFQLSMATAVDGLLKARYGQERYKNERNNLLRTAIYKKSDGSARNFLRNPSLAREVVLSAILLKAAGKDVHIITTNYDYAIEEISKNDDAARLDINYWGVKFGSYAKDPPTDYISDLEIPVVHIHGAVGRSRGSSSVVFSEPDYAEWRKSGKILDYVRRRFSSTHLLMIGASLRDHNIVSYLSDTRWQKQHRYALLPLQGDSAHDVGRTIGSFEPLLAIQEHRADELGITALLPDFYGQVHQFIVELRLAALHGASYSGESYQHRIRLWSRDFDTSANDEGQRKRVTRTLRNLAQILCSDVPEADQVKIEIWARRNVDGRTLELWCNSQSTLLGNDYWPHEKRLDTDSTSPAIRSFSNRTAVHGRVTDRHDGRWTHYLASTVMIDQDPYAILPIGAVVVLFHAPKVTDKILPSVKENQDEIVRHVLDVVEPILDPAN